MWGLSKTTREMEKGDSAGRMANLMMGSGWMGLNMAVGSGRELKVSHILDSGKVTASRALEYIVIRRKNTKVSL